MTHSARPSDAVRPWRAVVLTLEPHGFPGPLGHSLTGQALAAGRWSLHVADMREFGIGRHRAVDDTPAGGGPGMVLRCDVLGAAIDDAKRRHGALPLIALSPRGAPFRQEDAKQLAAGAGAMLLCGRFEGIDQRVIEGRGAREVSIGDYVLSSGDLAAMVMLDVCVRLLPGVVGAAASLHEESFEAGLLEHPQYTRPQEWEGRRIPDVLVSGDHGKIAAWRRSESERVTRQRRPDLLPQPAARR